MGYQNEFNIWCFASQAEDIHTINSLSEESASRLAEDYPEVIYFFAELTSPEEDNALVIARDILDNTNSISYTGEELVQKLLAAGIELSIKE